MIIHAVLKDEMQTLPFGHWKNVIGKMGNTWHWFAVITYSNEEKIDSKDIGDSDANTSFDGKSSSPTHFSIMRLNRVVKVGVNMRNNQPLKKSADNEHSTFT